MFYCITFASSGSAQVPGGYSLCAPGAPSAGWPAGALPRHKGTRRRGEAKKGRQAQHLAAGIRTLHLARLLTSVDV